MPVNTYEQIVDASKIYQHPQVRVYLGLITPEHSLANDLRFFFDGEEVVEPLIYQAQDGPDGFIEYYAADKHGRALPGPSTCRLNGPVHCELVANSGLPKHQVEQLQKPRTNVYPVDRIRNCATPEDIANAFPRKKRRVHRLNEETV